MVCNKSDFISEIIADYPVDILPKLSTTPISLKSELLLQYDTSVRTDLEHPINFLISISASVTEQRIQTRISDFCISKSKIIGEF